MRGSRRCTIVGGESAVAAAPWRCAPKQHHFPLRRRPFPGRVTLFSLLAQLFFVPALFPSNSYTASPVNLRTVRQFQTVDLPVTSAMPAIIVASAEATDDIAAKERSLGAADEASDELLAGAEAGGGEQTNSEQGRRDGDDDASKGDDDATVEGGEKSSKLSPPSSASSAEISSGASSSLPFPPSERTVSSPTVDGDGGGERGDRRGPPLSSPTATHSTSKASSPQDDKRPKKVHPGLIGPEYPRTIVIGQPSSRNSHFFVGWGARSGRRDVAVAPTRSPEVCVSIDKLSGVVGECPGRGEAAHWAAQL